ncbi:MAG: redoxin domain-containing protein [Bacteroidetes bacterium]|nr:redoxin domain-containing protein [Bacteroidota bacterium]
MIRRFYILAMLVILGISCSNTTPQEQIAVVATSGGEGEEQKQAVTTSISGVIQNGAGADLYVQFLRTTGVDVIDTVQIGSDGSFRSEFPQEIMGFYRIVLSEQNLLVLIVLPGDNIEINADASNLYQTYSVEGSEESTRLVDLNKILMAKDSINVVMQQAQMQNDRHAFQSALQEYDPIMAKVNAKLQAFVKTNPGSLSSLAALQNLELDSNFDLYNEVIEGLADKAVGLDFYESLRLQVVQLKKLAIGSPAPEISLAQPGGEVLKLSDLRGQYVLVDFWASWCGPCRRENPNVKKVYEKYHDKGFEILGVSLDKTEKAWLGAIQQDGLTWRHISDLKYWQSSVVPEYQIKGIPLTYLVDKDGIIIAKNLRGKSLEDKLAEIFIN